LYAIGIRAENPQGSGLAAAHRTGKTGSAFFKMKGLPPFIASRELLLSYFDDLMGGGFGTKAALPLCSSFPPSFFVSHAPQWAERFEYLFI